MRGCANRRQTATDTPPIRHHRSDRAGGVTQRAQQGELRAAGVGLGEGTSVDADERAAGGFAKASAPVAVTRPATDVLVDAERTHILRVLESCYWTIEGPDETAERLSLVVKIQEIALRQPLRKLLRIREFIENSRTCFHHYRHAPAKRHVPRRPEKRGNR